MQTYEKKIIGGVVGGKVAPSLINLHPSDFTNEDLGLCLRIAKQLEIENVQIDAEMIHARLQETEQGFYSPDDFKLMATATTSASVVFDAVEKVKAAGLKAFILSKAADLALQENSSGSELLDALKGIVASADAEYRTSENNFVFLSDLVEKTKAVYQDFNAGLSFAVATGFNQVDDLLLDGFSKGDEHIIVGFTGTGKSALALNFARNQAKEGIVVGAVSREMSDIENVMRLQAADSGIERWKMRKGLHTETYNRLIDHLESDFSKLPIAFDVRTDAVEALRPQVRQMVEKYNMQILYVDYLQLLTSNVKKESRANEVQTISRTLKQIAMENKIPVVSLCQFNRSAANAEIYDIISHLKESSGIEQDASTISYIQMEKDSLTSPDRSAQLTVLKNRNGATFKPVNLMFRGDVFSFREV